MKKTLQVKYVLRGTNKQFKYSEKYGKYKTVKTLDEMKEVARKLGYSYLNINNSIMEEIK